jgi:hypothetical protein
LSRVLQVATIESRSKTEEKKASRTTKEVAPVSEDIIKHRCATLDSAQAYLMKQIFPLEDNVTAKLDKLRSMAGSVCRWTPLYAQVSATMGPASQTKSQTSAPAREFKVIGQGYKKVPKDMTALPDAEVYHSFVPVLKGRRTAVTADGAKDPSDSETLYYAKHLFPQIAYPNEANIVWTARDIVNHDDHALSSLPDVVAYRDYPELSADNIRRHLRLYDDRSRTLPDDDPPAECILRYTFEKKLELWSHARGDDLARAMDQCMRCECLSAALRSVLIL